MTKTIYDMKQRLSDQEAWGKWNTAPLANQIVAAEREAMSSVRRLLQGAVTGVLKVTALVFYCAVTFAPFVPLIKPWILGQ